MKWAGSIQAAAWALFVVRASAAEVSEPGGLAGLWRMMNPPVGTAWVVGTKDGPGRGSGRMVQRRGSGRRSGRSRRRKWSCRRVPSPCGNGESQAARKSGTAWKVRRPRARAGPGWSRLSGGCGCREGVSPRDLPRRVGATSRELEAGHWELFPKPPDIGFYAQNPNIRIHHRDPPKIQTTAPTVR